MCAQHLDLNAVPLKYFRNRAHFRYVLGSRIFEPAKRHFFSHAASMSAQTSSGFVNWFETTRKFRRKAPVRAPAKPWQLPSARAPEKGLAADLSLRRFSG
jgi:hypothetical protein